MPLEINIDLTFEALQEKIGTGAPVTYTPSLDFSDSRNSQYVPLVFFGFP